MPSTWAQVEDEQVARLLTSPRDLELFKPFLARSCTVQQAADELGLPHLRVYRAVERMEALGLLRVVAELPRRGRASKLYRSGADAYFIPYRVAPQGTLEDVLRGNDHFWSVQLLEALKQQFEALEEGSPFELGLRVMYWLDSFYTVNALGAGDQNPQGLQRQFLAPEAPAVRNEWHRMNLTRAQAKALQLELSTLLERYAGQSEGGEYLLRIALAPLRP